MFLFTFTHQGHDTTAMSTSWALQLIGSHPEVQEKVHQELNNIFGMRASTQVLQCIKITMQTKIISQNKHILLGSSSVANVWCDINMWVTNNTLVHLLQFSWYDIFYSLFAWVCVDQSMFKLQVLVTGSQQWKISKIWSILNVVLR